MKKILLFVLFVFIYVPFFSNGSPLWIRYPAISPDGKYIVFSYQGNLFRVESKGGKAIPLTLNAAHDFMPVWSPDSKSIAFASNRYGNFDIFLVPVDGGEEKRLTFYSGNEYPTSITPDNKFVLFSSLIMDAVESAQFPDSRFTELYKVPTSGGRVSQVLTIPAELAKYNKSQTAMIYQDCKGYEDYWRKHHTSAVTRDIWICKNENTFQKLSGFKGEDREPVFGTDEQDVYYLSEQFGSFNVCKLSVNNPGTVEQITFHEKHPVRFLSITNDGTICYGFDGQVYTKKSGGESKAVAVEINYGNNRNQFEFITSVSGASEMAVSPDGSEIAFVYRGEVFVSSTEYSTTKQITHTPEQERSVSFSPDGKRILYTSEKNGSWNIYQTKISGVNEKMFCYSTVLEEAPVVETESDEFQPVYSPDGSEVAYLEERTTLKIKNLTTGKTRTVLDGSKLYSYADGDQKFEWSPNGKWLLYSSENNLFLSNVYLIDAKGNAEPIDLTRSGYNDTKPKWGMNGEMMIWTSDKESMRKQAVWWGAQADVYSIFFSQKAFDVFKLSEEEYNASNKEHLEYKFSGEKIDQDDFYNRKIRLTTEAKVITDLLITENGSKLFYLVSTQAKHELWMTDTRKKTSTMVVDFPASGNTGSLWKNKSDGSQIFTDKENKNIYVFIRGKIYKVNASSYQRSAISYNVEMMVNKPAEREYLFDHVWRQISKKFYNKNLHNVDWPFYKKEYQKFLPSINNGFDFSEMLSEMLGELNGSHTGCRYYPSAKGGDKTARLGLFYNNDYDKPGLMINEILENGPLYNADSKAKEGIVVLAIDGQEIGTGHNDFEYLNHKEDKNVLVTLFNPKTKEKWNETVKPISIYDEQELLYARWFKNRRQETEKLSNGRIGYVHVQSMNDASLSEVYSDALGLNKDKEAIIIDTRFNGGGWIHDDLVNLFNGQIYLNFNIRGVPFGHEPMNKWTKKSMVLMSEDNYSDANGFPFAYKENRIGKLLGAPVAGTMTAVWWERLMNDKFVFGIPQVGTENLKGEFLENKELEPDYPILNTNEVISKGRDQQIEKAVEVLTEELK